MISLNDTHWTNEKPENLVDNKLNIYTIGQSYSNAPIMNFWTIIRVQSCLVKSTLWLWNSHVVNMKGKIGWQDTIGFTPKKLIVRNCSHNIPFFCSFYIFTMSALCYFYVLSTFFITCKLVINLNVFQFCSQHLSNMLWHFLNMNSWIVTVYSIVF